MRTRYSVRRIREAHGMKHPCLGGLAFAAVVIAATPLALAHANESLDTFAVAPQQAVSFGTDDNDSDSFSVVQISRADNTVTVLLRPMGESCFFRFPVLVGRSVQLRTGAADGQSLLCKATLQPITEEGSARFDASCTEEPISREHKCPPDGDTASVDRPQH